MKIGDIDILQLSLAKYMPENKDIWYRLAQCNNLDESAFNYATWEFIDFVLGRAFDDHDNMAKAHQYGWTTTVNINECFIQCFHRLKKMTVIPSN
ncbi:unnamed protein product [Rotaria sp. Silwood2]|nr:unnamed protein product [Rotaria sp. Silwood2]CAF2480911.1 unnamed protein product [Rotaria sp. Silwood2]CAF2865355.1 unnamed protein product [Rotaria sp. Silwood2]CAF4111598.1 unnamed protein product [Rotaria sp. Silwood2]CAF4285075.1 unnamed protein product [Rotaria sp. Silwood2]